MGVIFAESGHRRKYPGDRGTAGAQRAIFESPADETPSFFRFEALFGNNRIELSFLTSSNKGLPFCFDASIQADRVHKVFDQVFLGSQSWAGIQGPRNLCEAGSQIMGEAISHVSASSRAGACEKAALFKDEARHHDQGHGKADDEGDCRMRRHPLGYRQQRAC